jgi:hypothetical protein
MLNKILALTVAFAVAGFAFADDKKADGAKTFEGLLVCAKCTLKDKDVKGCTNALKVKDGDKEVVYLLKDKGNKETYHKAICGADSESKVKVTGKVVEKDGKKWIENAKVEVQK